MFKKNKVDHFAMNTDIRVQKKLDTSQKEKKESVYTMPQKFMPEAPVYVSVPVHKKKSVLIWIFAVLALVLIITAIIVFFLQMDARENAEQASTGVQENQNIPETEDVTGLGDIAPTENVNDNSQVINSGTSINLNVNANLEKSINTELFGENTNAQLPVSGAITAPVTDYSDLPDASDKDRDELSDTEEELYGTKNYLPDSDRDGYVDGVELKNLFSPLVANEALLESGLVVEYSNEIAGWAVYYPAQWFVEPIDATKQQVLFVSQTDEGDFFEITVENNPNQYTAEEWYDALIENSDDEDAPQVDKSTPVTVGEIDGVVSPDGLVYYFATETQLIRILYTVGLQEEIAFRSTFEMMVNSFVLKNSSDSTIESEEVNQNVNAQGEEEIEESEEEIDSNTNQEDPNETGRGLNELL